MKVLIRNAINPNFYDLTNTSYLHKQPKRPSFFMLKQTNIFLKLLQWDVLQPSPRKWSQKESKIKSLDTQMAGAGNTDIDLHMFNYGG